MPDINIPDLERQVLEEEAEALEKFVKGTGEAPVIFRAASGAVLKAEGDSPIEFTLSHESDDRMGDIIRQDGWDLANFKKNPVMLWAHDSRGIPPIGKWSNVRVDKKSLLGTANFDSNDVFAVSIEDKVRRGYLNAVSVGFRPLEMEWRDGEDGGDFFRPAADFKKQELLETSVVSVPAHPKALRKALQIAIDGAPEAKRFIFMPGANLGTFEARAIEEPKPQEAKAAEADEVDTVLATVNGSGQNLWTAGYLQLQPDNSELVKALNSLEDAIRTALPELKEASPVSVDEDTEPEEEETAPEPELKQEPEQAGADDEPKLAIEKSLASIRGALNGGEHKDGN